MEKAFSTTDKNNDGFLQEIELKNLTKIPFETLCNKMPYVKKPSDPFFSNVDKNGDLKISRLEWI
jgi:hypothetical protein